MAYDPDVHHRRSIRLQGYDYAAAGAYFVTICTYQRTPLFQDPPYHEIAVRAWRVLPDHYPQVTLDAFVVMPNHLHGIILLTDDRGLGTGGIVRVVGAQHAAPLRRRSLSRTQPLRNVAPGSLGAVVRSFKSAVARQINLLRDMPSAPVWQRNYYEHIVRDEQALERIRQYIIDNPARWAFDRDNPEGLPDAIEERFWKDLG